MIWIGALITGIGWGLVETVVNPLIASLYPDEKTGKLNTLHAWWPGGLVIGGLSGVAMSAVGLGWQAKLFVVILPALAVVALSIGVRFPPTERAAAGVSMADMFRELLKSAVPRPFLLDVSDSGHRARAGPVGGLCPEPHRAHAGHPAARVRKRVDVRHAALRRAAGSQTVGHRLVVDVVPDGIARPGRPRGRANSPVTGLLAATLWGTGVCYMWPTMLATASERFPRGGALLMGLMGTAGTLSIRFVLPMMGSIYDAQED